VIEVTKRAYNFIESPRSCKVVSNKKMLANPKR